MVKKVGKYEIGKTLGEGTFGKVKYAINTETNEAVAIKVLDKEKIQKQNMGSQIKKEISIMKMIKHRHVVQLLEVLASRTKIFIVLELITGGELFDKIVSEGRLGEDKARAYFRQLITGVKYCHEQGVAHRDLKPENLLLDEQGILKISDFGLSAFYSGDSGESRQELLHTTCGTPNYVAPEVLADQGYDGRGADCWSCGVVLYVLLAGFLPFDEATMAALFQKIQAADFSYPSWFSEEVRGLLDNIMVADPAQRYTLADVLNHPWMQREDPPELAIPQDVRAAARAAAGGGEAAPAGAGGELDTANAITEASEEGRPTTAQREEAAAAAANGGPGGGGGADAGGAAKTLNAFELINQCGGMAITRMFQTGRERQIKRVYQFTTSLPVDALIEGMSKGLQDMGCEYKVFSKNNKVKAQKMTSSGMIGIVIQMYMMTPALHMVEIRRGKGDILEFYRVYCELVDGRARALLNVPEAMQFPTLADKAASLHRMVG
mmetsp:Transcript_42611/g.70586  ORF Transcript_42611/g.70586 Transcript_42611/m.70586 type:complete len:493 (-) Transcript_42611:501-1979(-)